MNSTKVRKKVPGRSRSGGRTLELYGLDHFVGLGKKGGPISARNAGSKGMAQRGSLGGNILVALVGSDGMGDRGRRRIELHGNPQTPEGCRKGGLRTCHDRHHVQKKVFQPKCELCVLEGIKGSNTNE